MKILKSVLLVAIVSLLGACKGTTQPAETVASVSPTEYTLDLLTETRTTQYYTNATVSAEDMSSILDAGRCASSGRNKQNWYFGAIINRDIIKEIGNTMPKRKAPPGKEKKATPTPGKVYAKAQFADAPAIIAIASTSSNFSLGLACQNMVIAASALGYGTKIVMSGTEQLNEDHNRTLLNIPDNMKVVIIMYVGVEDTDISKGTDGVTGASTRQALEKVSTIVQ